MFRAKSITLVGQEQAIEDFRVHFYFQCFCPVSPVPRYVHQECTLNLATLSKNSPVFVQMSKETKQVSINLCTLL